MNYFISDLHFGHANVIRFDNRPFSSVEEMDNELIRRWKNKVNENDDVFIIGDFAFRNSHDACYYLKQLPGKKHLIIGNHDKGLLKNNKAVEMFEDISDIKRIHYNKTKIVMCHYPLATWESSNHGSYMIYGHIHSNLEDSYYYMKNYENALNAGCMINNYEPVTLEELKENNRIFKAVN